MKQNEQSEADHKRFLFVKKRLKRAAALAGILIIALSLSGCKNFVETDVGAETKNTKQTVSETTVPINTKQTFFTANFETDGWTFEDFVSDVEINGIKLSLPCSYDELSKNFELQKSKFYSEYYDEETGKYCYSYDVRYKDYLVIHAEYCSELGENNLKAEDMCNFFVSSDLTGEDAYLFRFGEINNYSNMTQNDVEKILGKPNGETSVVSWYQFEDSKTIIIDYGGKNSVHYVNCYWNKKENNQ